MTYHRIRLSLPGFLCLFLHTLFAQVIPIAQARVQAAGNLVTVRGIVTSGPELGKIRYLQDGTGGIAAYPGTGSAAGFEAAASPGDSIEVTGVLKDYHGLLELTPIQSYQVIATGIPLPAPKTVDLLNLTDMLEGQLVRFSCATLAGSQFSNAGAYALTDAGGQSGLVYVGSDNPLLGNAIPASPVSIVGVLSQYDSDFQLLPRSAGDFGAAACFAFSGKMRQSGIQTNGFQIDFGTNLPGTAKIHYGPSPALGLEISMNGSDTAHTLQMSSLEPGMIYWLQAEATRNGETIFSEKIPFATQSLSSGEIRIYFNHPIHAASVGTVAAKGQSFQSCLEAIIDRIDSAQQTLDVAIYNNNRSDLTNALKSAMARGVRVRYVAAEATSNDALNPAPGFPVLYGNAESLMHDKFLVADAGLADKAWVMSGSMNWTSGNMKDDYNNLLFIQDQSLAKAYELEFEEMWGGNGDQPNPASARFGADKTDNTPHQFMVGGRAVESWFSPSDQTTSHIIKALKTADASLEVAMFTFTHNDLGSALIDRYVAGADLKVLFDNDSDPGTEYDYLAGQGLPVKLHDVGGLLHHKYAIVDAADANSDPLVVTGSHNWTFTAETANDENTLVLHDAGIAELFRAEFRQRWLEAGGVLSDDAPGAFPGVRIWPNPASDFLLIEQERPFSGKIEIWNASGQLVQGIAVGSSQTICRINTAALPPGFYFLKTCSPLGVSTLPFQKI